MMRRRARDQDGEHAGGESVYLERGRPVVVLVRWNGRGPRNALIRRDDGETVVRPFRGLRRPCT